jgi:hypothetical protein
VRSLAELTAWLAGSLCMQHPVGWRLRTPLHRQGLRQRGRSTVAQPYARGAEFETVIVEHAGGVVAAGVERHGQQA